MRKLDKEFIVSKEFSGGMTVDSAYDRAEKSGQSLTEMFLNMESSNPNSKWNISSVKKGLIKTGDEYSTPTQFAVAGYELFDLTPNLPLSKFFHQGIMPVRVGGGFAEQVSALRLTYAMAKSRLAGGNTNEVNVTDVMPDKIIVPAYTFQHGIVQGTVDLLKSAQVAYDVLGYKLEALRLSYQRELDYFAFTGNAGIAGITSSSPATIFYGGLLNAAGIGEEAVISDWYDWGVEEFVDHFVKIVTYLIVLNKWNDEVVPDTIVFPPELWQRLAKPAVVGVIGATTTGTGVVTSVFEYLRSALKARAGKDFNFVELPYTSINATEDYTTAGIVAKGTGGAGQVIFYRNSDKILRMPITMPLIGGTLQPSPTEFGYRQNFLAVVACPMIVYPTGIYKLYNVEKNFAVTYSLDGGTNAETNPATFVNSQLPITLAAATKAAVTFAGWFTDAAKTIQVTQITQRADITLYAKFI